MRWLLVCWCLQLPGKAISGQASFYPNWFYCLVEAAAAAALFAISAK
jgi:hypothetical protein